MRILSFFIMMLILGKVYATHPLQTDPWIGNYLNRQTGTSLQIKPKADGMYRGEFRYGTSIFPIRGINLLGIFTGEYKYQDKWFSFAVTGGQQAYTLTVDGVTLALDRLPPGAELPAPKSDRAGAQPSAVPSVPGKATDPAAFAPRENTGWTQKLRGRQLLFLETVGGGTQKAVINLYTNGQFSFESSSSYASGGSADFSYADQDKDSGTWRIEERQGAVLLVTISAKNGQRSEMRLQPGASATQVLINGKKFFIRELPA
jgi:hypothetical protein